MIRQAFLDVPHMQRVRPIAWRIPRKAFRPERAARGVARLPHGASAWTALALTCAAALPSQAQQPPDAVVVARVNDAAFGHWWPKYKRLMERLIENQDVDSGRLRVPPPDPEDLRRELHVGHGFRNPHLPGYTFFGVHTQGAVFEGLFLMDPAGRVDVLVNHDDPEDRKPILEDAYVDHMNRILARANARVDEPAEAVSLARFFLSTFFNFTIHPEDALPNAAAQDELQRVRVLNSYREIPRGRRVLRHGAKRAFLVFEPAPVEAREAIRPPVVLEPEPGSFLVKVFTWHPLRGELKSWEILMKDSHFAYFRDQTVARWKPYRFEGID